MSKKNEENEVGPAAAAAEPNANPYSTDALDRKERLRAILEGMPKFDRSATALTPAERRIATMTTVDSLEQAALFAEEEPNVGGTLSDVKVLRDKINFLLAYEGVREQAEFILADLDQTIAREKLEGAKYSRGLYRVARAYTESAPVKRLQSKVKTMQQTLGFDRRRKPAPPADDDEAAGKKQ